MTDISLKPALAVYTVAFCEEDRKNAQELGDALYNVLSRPIDHPNGFGPGALVFAAVDPNDVRLDEAEHVVVVPALSSASTAHDPDEVDAKIAYWKDKIGDRFLIIAAFDTRAGLAVDHFDLEVLRNTFGAAIPRSTIDAILLRIARLIAPAKSTKGLAISHDGSEFSARIAGMIDRYARLEDAPMFFFGQPYLLQNDRDWDDGDDLSVFLSVRTDAFGSMRTSSELLLRAKQRGLACLTIEALETGEPRSNPYGGNTPSLVWSDEPGLIVTRAMAEWLRMHLFEQQAQRAAILADLPPDPTVMGRAPELVDLVQPKFRGPGSHFVMYPDPELPLEEQRILTTTRPRLHLATPTTAFRYLGVAESRAAPLDGMVISMSISEISRTGNGSGVEQRHLQDTLLRLCRCLVSTGASIAYGGDLRKNGFTLLISRLLATYHQTARDVDKRLLIYQAAHVDEDLSDMRPHDFRHLEKRQAFKKRAKLPSPQGLDALEMPGLYFCDVRRMIAEDAQAGVLLGGQSAPKAIDDAGEITRPGYGGRFPGVVEEAWWMLQAGKPLYVAGGLGGAARLVADLLLNPEADTPDDLRDATWRAEAHYSDVIAQFDRSGIQKLLHLPSSLEELASAITEHGRALLASDEAALAWNGLDLSENRALMTSRDPVLIASLVLKGLLKSRKRLAEGDLAVELIHGDIRHAQRLDAVAVAVFDEAPILGAGRVLDEVLGNAVSNARASGHLLTNIENGGIDADWLITASLGGLNEQITPAKRAARAADQIARIAERHGLWRIGLVLFGGSMTHHGGSDAKLQALAEAEQSDLADAIIGALASLRGRTRIVLFERNKQTFDILHAYLQKRAGVDLTTGIIENSDAAPPVTAQESGFLHQFFSGDTLLSTFLLPSGTAVTNLREVELPEPRRKEIGQGVGPNLRETPSLDALKMRGADLGELLIGSGADVILNELGDDALLIHHDLEASQLPFEMLRSKDAEQPMAVRGGIRRVVSLRGLAA